MLDLRRLERHTLRPTPWGQVLFARVLRLDYRFPRRTEIVLEGVEHLDPRRRYILAMNHTDRYNYWPLQLALYQRKLGFTTTWVKGKYYESDVSGWFMDAMGQLPMPSRGYVITTCFRDRTGRPPSREEYRALRDVADGKRTEVPPELQRLLGDAGAFLADFTAHFDRMIAEVMRLHAEALDNGLHILVFPQGTRSKRLSAGHTGMAQVAMHLGVDVVPIGCNGSDHAYPGDRPTASGGRIVYRIGRPLRIDGPELAPFRVTTPFRPFSLAAARAHGEAFQGMTDLVMDRINDLLDPEYQYSRDHASDGVEGMRRFV